PGTAFEPPAAHYHTHNATSEFPYTTLAKTMRKVLSDYGEKILVKSPNRGCAELLLAICGYLARSSGITVLPEQVIIGSGAEYLYSLIVQLLAGDRIFALENPSYEKIHRVYQANGIPCDMLKLGKDGIKSCELARTKASVLHVTPFNSFPSGITASLYKRYEYIRWAEERNGYIIEDNYDSELTISRKNEDTVFSLANQGSVIYLNTFSKTIAPSIRIGYMVLPKGLLSTFESKLGFYSCTVPIFEQYVLAELIQSGDFERHINRVRRAKRRQGL
ncbi:MAG: PLP-dependent aminotransferase family protein, partial [Clostridia bacterium]